MFFNYATKFLVMNKNIFFLADTQRNTKKKISFPSPNPVPKQKDAAITYCLFDGVIDTSLQL